MLAAVPIPPRSLWLRLSGLIPAAVVAAPIVLAVTRDAALLGSSRVQLWAVAFLVFLVSHVAALSARANVLPTVRLVALVIIQSIAALAVNAIIPTPFAGVSLGGILLVVVAAQLPSLLTTAAAGAWIAIQTLALGAIYSGVAGWHAALATTAAGAYGAFQVFAYLASGSAYREALARRELAELNALLVDAQHRLSLASAAAERNRLWRELHDVLGHHLAALSLSLEAAANLADGRAKELVRQASALTRLLLADIRSVMSDVDSGTRPATQADFLRQLSEIGTGFSGLTVSHEFDQVLPEIGPEAGHALIRAAQECVTNAARHASARCIRIRLHREDESLVLTATDDGVGAVAPMLGSGLSGMRARLEQLGGSLTISTAPNSGFEVRASIPISGPPLGNAA